MLYIMCFRSINPDQVFSAQIKWFSKTKSLSFRVASLRRVHFDLPSFQRPSPVPFAMATNVTFVSISGQKTPASVDLEGMTVGDLRAKAQEILKFDDENGKFNFVLVVNGKVLDDATRPASSYVADGAHIVYMRRRNRGPAAAAAPGAAAAASPSPASDSASHAPASAATPAAAAAPATPATPAAAAAVPASTPAPASAASAPAALATAAAASGSGAADPHADGLTHAGSGDTVVDYIATSPEAMRAFIAALRAPSVALPEAHVLAANMARLAALLETAPLPAAAAHAGGSSGSSGSGAGLGLSSLLSDPAEAGAEGGGDAAWERAVALDVLKDLVIEARTGAIDMRVPAGAGGAASPSQRPQGPPPVRVRLTEEDEAAVGRLMEMGFPRAAAAEAYLVCDKNEEAAANYLLNEME